MKRLVLLLFLFLALNFSRADEAPVPSAQPVTDPALVQIHFHEVLQRPEFRDIEEDDFSTQLTDSLRRWLYQFGQGLDQLKVGSQMQNLASLLSTVFIFLTFVGIIYIIARLFWTRRFDYRLKTQMPSAEDKVALPRASEEALRLALENKNWTEAWQLRWRQFLGRLEERHWVYPDRSRTNREYIAQVIRGNRSELLPPLLQRLIASYDLFIYGQKPLTEEDWNGLQRQLEQASKLLELDATRSPRREGFL